MVHRLKGHYLDTKHPIIIENLMGIRRVKGSIQKGKKPILINHLKSIVNVIDEQKCEEIKKLRDRSIILIGFGGGFRRTELISIDHEDLEFVPEGLKITIKRSKTDQSVVLLMKEYLNLAGIENKNFAGHSLRAGFATVAAESGADERSIMAMTGHKTTQMVRRYIREANIFKNNALNKIKI